MEAGILYIVATPIGNLGDITLRVLEILKSVDFIACEDTRVTSKLLSSFEISKTMISYHQHSSNLKAERIISELLSGKSVALVTDAGTPGISDPGGILVEEAVSKNINVVGVPGPSSVTLALSVSGFPSDQFLFLGYFPKKKGRQTLIKNLEHEKRTVVFFESPHRIKKTLSLFSEVMPNRDIVICRELTKKFEEIYRGRTPNILEKIKEKGELVVVLRGQK